MKSNCGRFMYVIVAGLVSSAVVSSASAQLMGHDMTADWRFPDFNSVLESHQIVISDAVELPSDVIINDFKFDIDVGDNWVEFRFNAAANWSDVSFNGWYFADTNDQIPPIKSYTIDSFSNGISGTNNIVLGNDANAFWADFGGMMVAGNGDFIRLAVEFEVFNLTITGSCPGPMAFDVTGATPNGDVAFVYALGTGSFVIPNGKPCAGTTLGLNNSVKLARLVSADGNGNASTNSSIPQAACGSVFVQAIDLSTCSTSNVSLIQ